MCDIDEQVTNAGKYMYDLIICQDTGSFTSAPSEMPTCRDAIECGLPSSPPNANNLNIAASADTIVNEYDVATYQCKAGYRFQNTTNSADSVGYIIDYGENNIVFELQCKGYSYDLILKVTYTVVVTC